jgi:hypothetical protein
VESDPGRKVVLEAERHQAVMQWTLTDAGPLDGPVHIQVGTLADDGWYVRHTGFGARRFDGKNAAWRAVRGLMSRHEGRWTQASLDAAPFVTVCRPDGSRVLYDMNDDGCLHGCWGDQKDRLWDRYLAAMSAGTTLRRTETHELFGGYIELVRYDDPLEGGRRHVVVVAKDPGSDYRAVDYPEHRQAEREYESSVYANADEEFPYRATDIAEIQVDRRSDPPEGITVLHTGELIDSGDVYEYRRLYSIPPRTDWPVTPRPSVPAAPVSGMTATPRDWGPGEMSVREVTPAEWQGPDAELRSSALSLAVLPDGREWLASAHDGAAHVWNVADGGSVNTFSGHSEWVLAVALEVLHDGRVMLATGGKDALARIWSAREGEALAEIEAHRGPANAVAWARPPGEVPRLVTGGDDAAVRIWDVESELELGAFTVGERNIDIVCSVATAVLSDGHLCVAAAAQGTSGSVVHVWDATAGTKSHEFVIEHPGSAWPTVAVTTLVDRSYRVAAAAGSVVRVWDGHTGQEIGTWPVADRGAGDVALAALPDLRVAVAAASGRETLVWDAESGAVLARLDHQAGRMNKPVDLVADLGGGLLLAAGRENDHPARLLRLRPPA